MKIHVICVAYKRTIPLRGLIDSFLLQTNPNWILYIVHDGKMPQGVKNVSELYTDDRILFIETEKRNGHYGHPNRKTILETLPSCDDYVLMTNDDNYYVPRFVEFMLKPCGKDIGIVCCDVIHSHFDYNYHKSVLRENGIDMGAFIVRLDVAKATGFNHVDFSADGKYAEQCSKRCRRRGLETIHIEKGLFVHN